MNMIWIKEQTSATSAQQSVLTETDFPELGSVGPTLNIDRSAACFYKPSKTDDLIQDIIRGDLSRLPKLSEFDKKKVRKELTGLQVEATHISYEGTTGSHFRKYRVLGVSV
jgi:hypothetical protein